MILVAGHCCPDDVYYVEKYPVEDSTVGSRTEHNSFLPNYPLEDSDQRCTKQSWERGGNASNNATVLACLGASVEYFGTLADDNLLRFLQNDMDSLGIKHSSCPILDCGGNGPISVVVCSEETGSRTIIHAKGNLTELSLEHFQSRLDIGNYSWIHFEGRNEAALPSILAHIKEYNMAHSSKVREEVDPSLPNYKKAVIPISMEIEKHKASLATLLPFADVLLIGKDFALLQGAKDCKEAARIISGKVEPGTVIVCPWGDQGAAYCIAKAEMKEEDIKKRDAYKPDKIIDSLGAGDTFNATVVHCLHKGLDLDASVELGCRVASEKLKIRGFKGLKEIVSRMYPQLN